MNAVAVVPNASLVPPGETTLRHLLAEISARLADPEVTDVQVNRPGEMVVERAGHSETYAVPSLTFDVLRSIVILAARRIGKNVGNGVESVSATLPDGQRLKGVLPPACDPGTAMLSVRQRALSFTPTLDWLDERGYFDDLRPVRDWKAFWRDEVIGARLAGLVSGLIGCGKTTFVEALLHEIAAMGHRQATLERSPEWIKLLGDTAKFYFDENRLGDAERRMQDLLMARPRFGHVQELQGPEAWAWKRLLKVGLPGYTTAHAPEARLAIPAVVSMQQQSEHGRGTPATVLDAEVRQYVRVVAHVEEVPPRTRAERTRYRMLEVLMVGRTPEEDRTLARAEAA